MSTFPSPKCCLCDNLMERGHFLCVDHWNKVSKATRKKITAAQKRVRVRGKEATAEELRPLFRAQDEALAEIGGSL